MPVRTSSEPNVETPPSLLHNESLHRRTKFVEIGTRVPALNNSVPGDDSTNAVNAVRVNTARKTRNVQSPTNPSQGVGMNDDIGPRSMAGVDTYLDPDNDLRSMAEVSSEVCGGLVSPFSMSALLSSDSCPFDGAMYPSDAGDQTEYMTYDGTFLPRYRCGFAWRDDSPSWSITAARTETDSPLAKPSAEELSNREAVDTVTKHPQLFNRNFCRLR
ncbi:hypothetical protein PM082_023730 [Marasmius tenuissimus]|nr:hypothetical protein PM082_023730 [Marasmius tenuissimus]